MSLPWLRLSALSIALSASLSSGLRAQTFDLQTDWSTSQNPNGVWSYFTGGEVAGNGGDRQGDPFNPPGPPMIWGGGFYGWSKSIGSEAVPLDLRAGDVYGHTFPTGPISIRWTSPVAGTVQVSGGTWALRDIGRGNSWALSFDQGVLASGQLFSGDPWDRANPATFVFSRHVNVGDSFEFSAVDGSGVGDYLGVRMTVAVTAVPEPDTYAMLAAGLGVFSVLAWRKRRQKQGLER